MATPNTATSPKTRQAQAPGSTPAPATAGRPSPSAAVSAAPVEDATAAATPTNAAADVATTPKRGRKKGQPIGPMLRWTDARIRALVTYARHGDDKSLSGLVAALKADAAFAGVENLITPEKVRAKINEFNEQGVKGMPQFPREKRATLTVDELNSI